MFCDYESEIFGQTNVRQMQSRPPTRAGVGYLRQS